MAKFIINERGVCANPEKVCVSNRSGYIEVAVAQFDNGKWGYSLTYKLNNRYGGGLPSEKFAYCESKEKAYLAALDELIQIRFPAEYSALKKQMFEKLGERAQLSLF